MNFFKNEITEVVAFIIYVICLLVSIVVSIVTTSNWFNIVPIIALISAGMYSADEAADAVHTIQKWIKERSEK